MGEPEAAADDTFDGLGLALPSRPTDLLSSSGAAPSIVLGAVDKAGPPLEPPLDDTHRSALSARPSVSAKQRVASTFPQTLMEMLSDPAHSAMISWTDSGKAFVIHSKKAFVADVIPKYFGKATKFTSFTRKLNRWGFSRSGRNGGVEPLGSYQHELFRRGDWDGVQRMTCGAHSDGNRSKGHILKAIEIKNQNRSRGVIAGGGGAMGGVRPPGAGRLGVRIAPSLDAGTLALPGGFSSGSVGGFLFGNDQATSMMMTNLLDANSLPSFSPAPSLGFSPIPLTPAGLLSISPGTFSFSMGMPTSLVGSAAPPPTPGMPPPPPLAGVTVPRGAGGNVAAIVGAGTDLLQTPRQIQQQQQLSKMQPTPSQPISQPPQSAPVPVPAMQHKQSLFLNSGSDPFGVGNAGKQFHHAIQTTHHPASYLHQFQQGAKSFIGAASIDRSAKAAEDPLRVLQSLEAQPLEQKGNLSQQK